MKRIAILLAGMLLVGGMVFADGAPVDTSSKVSVNGKVNFTVINVDSTTKSAIFAGNGDDDQYFKLNLTKQLDATTSISLGYDTDDSNPDMIGDLRLTKQVNDKVEAEVAVDVDTTTGLKFAENNGGDTHLKYSPTKDLSISFKPFEADTGIGDNLATKDTQDTHGVEVNATLVDGLTATTVVNFVDVAGKDKMGLKAGATYTGMKNLSVTGEFTTNDTANTKTAVDVRGSYVMGALTLSGEAMNYTPKAGYMASDDSGMGLFAKAAYDLGTLTEGVTATTNVSFKSLGEKFNFDDDYSADALAGGNTTVIGAEFDVAVSGVTISNSFEMVNADNKVFTDEDGAKTDSKTTFTTEVGVEF